MWTVLLEKPLEFVIRTCDLDPLEKRQSSHNFRTIWYSSELENLFLWSFNHIQLLVKLVIMATARGAGTVFALELQFLFSFFHYVEFGISIQVCTSVACTAITNSHILSGRLTFYKRCTSCFD
uniref:Uncharacterized protein n=1 Tax=Cacopsylla melanoneura TaxID=428564 RepID=A0A8D8Z837_9HEMI